jgi:hypothetical protein
MPSERPAPPPGAAPRLSRPWLAAAVAAAVGNMALHLPVTDVFDALAARLGFFAYNRLLTRVSIALAVATLVAVLVRRSRLRPALWSATLVLIALAIAAQNLLLVASIENIHYPQYALLAILLGRSGLSLEASWMTSTLAGIVDESYQFLFLHRGTFSYLDWNDITLNAIGAGFGIVFLLWNRVDGSPQPLWPRRTVAAVVSVCLLGALIAAPPHVAPFFRTTPTLGLRYHVMAASEGVAAIAVLWFGLRLFLARGCADPISNSQPPDHA